MRRMLFMVWMGMLSFLVPFISMMWWRMELAAMKSAYISSGSSFWPRVLGNVSQEFSKI